MDPRPFNPAYSSGAVVTPAAGAAAVTTLPKGCQNVVFTNQGANLCYVRIADEGDASAADYCIPAGAQICLTKAPEQTRFSHISASGTTLHYIPGNGW